MTASSTAVEALLRGLSTIRDWQEDFYRDLHAHPELSHQEYETARKVAARLRDWGYDVHDRIGGTGVIGVLRNGPGPTVLLRADMDALAGERGHRTRLRQHRANHRHQWQRGTGHACLRTRRARHRAARGGPTVR